MKLLVLVHCKLRSLTGTYPMLCVLGGCLFAHLENLLHLDIFLTHLGPRARALGRILASKIWDLDLWHASTATSLSELLCVCYKVDGKL